MLVGEIMSKCDAVCTEDVPLRSVYELIQNSGQGFVVVIDSEVHKVPIGLVTEHSICKQVVGRGRSPKNLAAGNVLEARVPRIDADAPITDCGRLFADDRTKVILAVNGKREFLGVVFRESFARAVSSSLQAAAPVLQKQVPQIPTFGWAH